MFQPGLWHCWSQPCPRILLQGALGKGKEIQFVGSSWLDAPICAPLLIKLHSEQGRTGVLNKSQPRPPRGFNPSLPAPEPLFILCSWKSRAKIEAVSKSLLVCDPPKELQQAQGWLLPLGCPCSVPFSASWDFQHHVGSLRKGCSSPKLSMAQSDLPELLCSSCAPRAWE